MTSFRKLMIKLKSWEYWPWQLVYLPVGLYSIGHAIKSGSPFYFSASNPAIKNGGLMSESKSDILAKIPEAYRPLTVLFQAGPTALEEVLNYLREHAIQYPFILKPDYGERGKGVQKIEDEQALTAYCLEARLPFIMQPYIDYPLELGVFYARFPASPKGTISSVVIKEMLKIKGDGKRSVRTLMESDPRAFLQLARFETEAPYLLEKVPTQGQLIELESIGNHCRGTKFINGNHLINKQLEVVFDTIALQIDGFYYGRFDLRCASLEDLYAGQHIQIMELNGAKAEPAHIYHPGYSLKQAYTDLFDHWRVMAEISRENHRRGVPYTPFWKGIKDLGEMINMNRQS
ncbi:D-alanine--D-alanine ligase [Persicobacter psychrovividus]|uniref:D-alanine--D-alanine ligase n=2 Tax=Persicobacter psychrovividus TaxID=387638 RepID=A0ABN6LB19_9BACT|nr:D-alanine--D-alanine ligase [Persicobacter psychrovividus]